MARMVLDNEWALGVEGKILRRELVDETLAAAVAKRWLVRTLSEYGVPFKVYQLGCGVARITTDTNKCPCCKRRFR